MKKTIPIVLVLALGLASVSLAAEGTWTTRADMPTVRWDLSTCVVDGKIYAIGGASPVYQASRIVEAYDPATDTWSTKSEMPTARQGLSTSVVNGKIYAIGGGSAYSSAYASAKTFSTVEEYDPATDAWTTKSEMPTARGFHDASVVDGRIYIIGGTSSIPNSGTAILAVEVYEPATDTWTRKANIPARRDAGSTSVVNGKIYAFGGYSNGRRAHEYDPVADTWTRKADMPTWRVGVSTSVVEGRIYAIGGHPGYSPYPGIAIVDVYDPATDTWTTAPDMPTGRFDPRTSVVDGKIYTIGGMARWIGTALGTVEEYDPYPFVVDFNGDGIVDGADICMMVEYWHTDEPFFDIAPQPFGDGIVDVQDLILLSEHLFEEIFPVELIGYWKLDEEEGDIAYNSISDNYGIISGDPTWQPDSGQIAGALEFDGINDYVETDFVLSPADGAFSVFAWIKGGAPGQVIISQTDGEGAGETWLGMDALGGKLMTGLRPPATRSPTPPMVSDFVITDGQWHHIGIVVVEYQSMRFRYLYLDGVRIFTDTQSVVLPYANGGMYIGADKNLDAASFFSGLIDDVRIYDVALSADEIAFLAQ